MDLIVYLNGRIVASTLDGEVTSLVELTDWEFLSLKHNVRRAEIAIGQLKASSYILGVDDDKFEFVTNKFNFRDTWEYIEEENQTEETFWDIDDLEAIDIV